MRISDDSRIAPSSPTCVISTSFCCAKGRCSVIPQTLFSALRIEANTDDPVQSVPSKLRMATGPLTLCTLFSALSTADRPDVSFSGTMSSTRLTMSSRMLALLRKNPRTETVRMISGTMENST